MLATSEAGAIANQAEERKGAKYAELLVSHHFVPVAIETSGVFGQGALSFIRELGSRLQAKTGESQSPPPEAKNCCGHAEGQCGGGIGHHD